jgi:hypothetical protein
MGRRPLRNGPSDRQIQIALEGVKKAQAPGHGDKGLKEGSVGGVPFDAGSDVSKVCFLGKKFTVEAQRITEQRTGEVRGSTKSGTRARNLARKSGESSILVTVWPTMIVSREFESKMIEVRKSGGFTVKLVREIAEQDWLIISVSDQEQDQKS